MQKRQDTKPALRLRPVDGLLEDVALAVPVGWMGVLRAQSVKLGISVESLLVQHAGHIAAEAEALESAAESPKLGDDVGRFLLRGGYLKSFQREANRLGLPVVTLMHRTVGDAAAEFDGRAKDPQPKPLSLASSRRRGLIGG